MVASIYKNDQSPLSTCADRYTTTLIPNLRGVVSKSDLTMARRVRFAPTIVTSHSRPLSPSEQLRLDAFENHVMLCCICHSSEKIFCTDDICNLADGIVRDYEIRTRSSLTNDCNNLTGTVVELPSYMQATRQLLRSQPSIDTRRTNYYPNHGKHLLHYLDTDEVAYKRSYRPSRQPRSLRGYVPDPMTTATRDCRYPYIR